MFGPKFLSLFPRGGINIHPSLLPRHRGPTPIQGAILCGDAETGVCIQRLAPELDAGDILACARIPLAGRESAASLSALAAAAAAALLPGVIRGLAEGAAQGAAGGALTGRPQTGAPTYTSLIAKEDGRIDWNLSARAIDAQVRAFTPWPLSFTGLGGQTLYILEGIHVEGFRAEGAAAQGQAARPGTVAGIDRNRGILIQTGSGMYAVSRLQWQARKALDWKAFLNGARDFIGSVLC
jgi:methionyl-tRNA formyltransferase